MSTALFQEIYDQVVVLTGRPDLVDETELAVRRATRSAHSRFNFPRDVATELVKLPNAIFTVSLDIQTLLPRLRTISQLRPLDINFAPVLGVKIPINELGDIYDPEYGTLLDHVAYIAGTQLNIRCMSGAYGFVVEYFQMPDVKSATYNSWVAQLAPDAITYSAAATVFSANGNQEKAAAYTKTVNDELIPELISQYGLSAGR